MALDALLTDRIGLHDPEDLTQGEVLSLLLDMEALYAQTDAPTLARETQSGALHYRSVSELVQDLNNKIDTFYANNASVQRRLEQDHRVLTWLQGELENVQCVLHRAHTVEEGFSTSEIQKQQSEVRERMQRSMAGERGRRHGELGGGVKGVFS